MAQARHDRVELAAQADAEGGIEEGGRKGRRGGDGADQERARGESDNTGERKDEADELGELQRRLRFALLDGAEAGRHEPGEHPTVGMLARPADRPDGEDDGLQTQNPRRRQRTCGGHDKREHQDRGRDPGGETRAANVDGVCLGGGVAARHGGTPRDACCFWNDGGRRATVTFRGCSECGA